MGSGVSVDFSSVEDALAAGKTQVEIDAYLKANSESTPYKYTMLSICPTFTVIDWDKAKPVMDDFIAKTKTEDGCVYYGWVREGSTLKCREMYVDGAAANAHLENVGSCIGALLEEGVATLDSINVQGPADELEIVKPSTEALGTVYFRTDGGFTNMAAASGGEEGDYSLCSIHPTFTVIDWDKAKPVMDDFIAKTKTEDGCVYYGWVREGNTLKCREGYLDGAAMNAHLENVGSCIGALLEEGVATLDSINVQGPADELEIVKPSTEALGTVYFRTDGGFGRYTMR
jgi:quinol monooxygenase YgiN